MASSIEKAPLVLSLPPQPRPTDLPPGAHCIQKGRWSRRKHPAHLSLNIPCCKGTQALWPPAHICGSLVGVRLLTAAPLSVHVWFLHPRGRARIGPWTVVIPEGNRVICSLLASSQCSQLGHPVFRHAALWPRLQW